MSRTSPKVLSKQEEQKMKKRENKKRRKELKKAKRKEQQAKQATSTDDSTTATGQNSMAALPDLSKQNSTTIENPSPPLQIASSKTSKKRSTTREDQRVSSPSKQEESTVSSKRQKKNKKQKNHDRAPQDISNRHATTTDANAPPRYSFQVDETDHCETPLKAYQDIAPVLDRLCKSLGKTRSTLKIYDPYYCNGGVNQKLASLGFTLVINRNRDFYQDIADKNIPDYDVLVTNPPYSGVHMEKLLSFCRQQSQRQDNDNNRKPFLLLLPHFVYTKDYYQRALQSVPWNNNPNAAAEMLKLFFLIPETRYSYIPPAWVTAANGSKVLEKGKDKTAPFPSFWYCHSPRTSSSSGELPTSWLTQTFGPSGMVRPKHVSKLRFANSTNDIPRDFKGEFDTTKKRPNPKARKRMAAKKRRTGV